MAIGWRAIARGFAEHGQLGAFCPPLVSTLAEAAFWGCTSAFVMRTPDEPGWTLTRAAFLSLASVIALVVLRGLGTLSPRTRGASRAR